MTKKTMRKMGRIATIQVEILPSAVSERTCRRSRSRSRSVGRNVVQHLREVATDLRVGPDGQNDPVEVLAVHPLCDRLEGLLQGQPQPALQESTIDLLPKRSLVLLRQRSRPCGSE